MKFALIYLLIVNAAGFLVMTVDKLAARNQSWRIPERTLFLLAAIGGSIGTIAGMYLMRHKTRHWYFVWGMPLILSAQIILVLWYLLR